MTKEEILNETTRDQKIERMLDEVNNWDAEVMVAWIQGHLHKKFNDLNDNQIKDEYVMWFDNEFEDIDDEDEYYDDDDWDDDWDDEDCNDCEASAGEGQTCICEWETVYQNGCQCGGK